MQACKQDPPSSSTCNITSKALGQPVYIVDTSLRQHDWTTLAGLPLRLHTEKISRLDVWCCLSSEVHHMQHPALCFVNLSVCHAALLMDREPKYPAHFPGWRWWWTAKLVCCRGLAGLAGFLARRSGGPVDILPSGARYLPFRRQKTSAVSRSFLTTSCATDTLFQPESSP